MVLGKAPAVVIGGDAHGAAVVEPLAPPVVVAPAPVVPGKAPPPVPAPPAVIAGPVGAAQVFFLILREHMRRLS